MLTELLLRGPQAPGELARRVGRLGFHADADGVRAVLDRLAARTPKPLVEELPHRPRERDRRFAHRLGEQPESHDDDGMPRRAEPPPPSPEPRAPTPAPADLATRVARLEAEVRDLRQRLDERNGVESDPV